MSSIARDTSSPNREELCDFIEVVKEYFTALFAERGICLHHLARLNVSCVNFIFGCELDGKEGILKANLFGRSMLYAYERFQEVGAEAFKSLIANTENAVNAREIAREITELEFLRSLGVHVPAIRCVVAPVAMILERVEGETLDYCFQDTHALRLVDALKKVHTSYPPVGLSQRQYVCTQGVLVVNDTNFTGPIVIPNISQKAASLIESYKGPEGLLHGDFKANNVLVSKEELIFIDPRLCIGVPHADIGKFIVRMLLTKARGRTDMCSALALFVRTYARQQGLDVWQAERLSILHGLVELVHLLSKPRRPNIDILGEEMPELYNISSTVSHLHQMVLNEGKLLLVTELAEVVDSLHR